ncbi:MAG: serine--tRNA ligase, partial [Alphaproteobacteria bacterium]|nr:serine--tRNA ligase [Alphaproteobacteria bacterium]
MLDIKFIRENPDIVKNACTVKGITDNTDKILELDARVRELKTITQSKTAEKNKITREIPTATDKAPLIAKSKEINAEIA